MFHLVKQAIWGFSLRDAKLIANGHLPHPEAFPNVWFIRALLESINTLCVHEQ